MPTLDTTTNNSFRYPTDADNGVDFATGIADLAADVDGMWSSGTLAARPAAGKLNRVYWATDTKLLYQDNGTAWQTILLAGAWVPLTLGTEINAGTGYLPSVRIEGDSARFKGAVTASLSPQSVIGALPSSGFYPVQPVGVPIICTATVAATDLPGTLEISTSGAITLSPSQPLSPTNTIMYLDVVRYSLS